MPKRFLSDDDVDIALPEPPITVLARFGLSELGVAAWLGVTGEY